jgi:NADH-quinone oxidoreductase subunit G
MITIYIDNQPYQVKPDQNLLQACLSLGFDLPYFCWHPAMHSVGACRQCAVKQFKDENDTRGRIVMSCMTPLSEGMRVSVDDPEAKSFRGGITEFLMKNHPHDCPVCDEGGECHLQDMTVMTGHNYRRTRFKKRTHRNQDLGPFINHEMNRCIACYRCVRFYRGIAGGRDLDVFASHDHVYFGRHEDGVLESEFSGNLVEICPTGVFTDKTFKRHYTRKWDLQTAPSICVHCGLGCNTIAGERYGTLRRILNRFNHEVNGYFLCDRGRFGYEFVNSEKRIRLPFASPSLNPSGQGRDNNALSPGGRGLGLAPAFTSGTASAGCERGPHPVSKETALKHISDIFSRSKGIIGIGSPRASLESNFALRTLVGPDNFYSGMSEPDHKLVSLIIDILQKGPARTPSLHDVQMADAILVLGEDVSNTAPLLDLALQQAVRNKPKEKTAAMRIPEWDDNAVRNAIQNETGPLYLATIAGTKLDAFATETFHAAPADISRLGFAIAHELNPNAPHLPPLPAGERTEVRGDVDVMPLASAIAQALKNARQPLIISGTSMGNESIIQAAANIAWALCESGKPTELCYAVPECNSLGLGMMAGKNFNEFLKAPSPPAGEGWGEAVNNADTIIILENDLYRRTDQKSVDALLNHAKNIIVIDHLINPTSSRADIALPAGACAESDGTLVNNEGRAQRFYQVFKPHGDIQESWKWINDIMKSLGKSAVNGQQSFDDLINAMASALPLFASIRDIAPSSEFRLTGQKIPRQPHRYSGRTAMTADISVHEPKPPQDTDTPLAFSMEGYQDQPPAPLISRYWSPGWNSVQALNKFQQEVGGPLNGGDAGKRLIEPSTLPLKEDPPRPLGERAGVRGNSGKITFFPYVPETSKPKNGEQIDIPFRDSFSPEELSSYAPAIVERTKLMLLTKAKTP